MTVKFPEEKYIINPFLLLPVFLACALLKPQKFSNFFPFAKLFAAFANVRCKPYSGKPYCKIGKHASIIIHSQAL